MKSLPAILMGLFIGVALTLITVTALKGSSTYSMMGGSTTTHSSSMMSDADNSMTMGQMVGDLKGKSGDDLDKAFLSGMIVHHQGAIDMAKEVQTSAKHEEVRKLAGDIIKAQTGEIAQMRDWQKQWGY